METLTPRNWATFQHYKDRAPPWIKLHKGILDDYDFHCLPDASKALAPCLWLLASEYEGGAIPFNVDKIAFRMRMTAEKLLDALKPLILKGFFCASEGASGLLAEGKQDATLETEAEAYKEEREGEKSRGQLRASRLPNDWSPSVEDVEFCRKERPDLNPSGVAAAFRDYWVGLPDGKARKKDWSATWRNWVRNQRGSPQQRFSKQAEWDASISEFVGETRQDPYTIEAEYARIR